MEEILIEIKKHRISKGGLKVDLIIVDEVIENPIGGATDIACFLSFFAFKHAQDVSESDSFAAASHTGLEASQSSLDRLL